MTRRGAPAAAAAYRRASTVRLPGDAAQRSVHSIGRRRVAQAYVSDAALRRVFERLGYASTHDAGPGQKTKLGAITTKRSVL